MTVHSKYHKHRTLGESKNYLSSSVSLSFCWSPSRLKYCDITDVSSLTQSLTNTNALQFLKELDLRNNMIGDSVKQLTDVLRDSNSKL